ncbi:NAD(P)-dependent oxidoreductase [bacterium]|nr:NAD(P)-dependent oxidoreductase [bacterium]
MERPGLIVTGASGFVGRHLLERLQGQYRIYGIARRSQARSGAPVHPEIRWYQVDIGNEPALRDVFTRIREDGGADTVLHLAAHYDFTGEGEEEYWRTNVNGLRHVLEACRHNDIRHFVFSSSVAACDMPREGRALNERTPPDGRHIYSRTKGVGEKMLEDYRAYFPSTIVRFAALFSDWCEYPPLFVFLGTWLSSAWNRCILGGRGRSAIPYLHVEDAIDFLQLLLRRLPDLESGEVVICSPDRPVSHRELFRDVTGYVHGSPNEPIFMPKMLIRPGIRARMLLGRLAGELPFERPWMADYVDQVMAIDASHTRRRLDWEPRPRRELLHRLPFLLENLRSDPVEWRRRNRAAMRHVTSRPNLRIHWVLGRHEDEIMERYTHVLTERAADGHLPSYGSVPAADHEWNHRLILHQLMNSIRTRERSVFLGYCRDLAERRRRQGYSAAELCGALEELNRICVDVLERDPDAEEVRPFVHQDVSATILFGCDRVMDVFERFEGTGAPEEGPAADDTAPDSAPADDAPTGRAGC